VLHLRIAIMRKFFVYVINDWFFFVRKCSLMPVLVLEYVEYSA
jgi:hypothetical protein